MASSYLTYKGDPRIVGGMLVATAARYLVEIVETSPVLLAVRVEDCSGSCELLYPSPAAFLRDWEEPFGNCRIDAPL